MPISIKIQPRKDFIKKDGTAALYLWVTIDRKVKKYQLPYYIDPLKWDWEKQALKGNTPLVNSINLYISNELSKANRISFQISNTGKVISFQEFDNLYSENGLDDYFSFAEKYIEKNTGKLSPLYLKQIRGESSKLRKFKENVSFQDINHQFLGNYEYYMRNVLNNTSNTVYKTFKRMKTIINEAMIQNEHLYSRSPFVGYKLRTEPTSRKFLSKDELDMLYSMRNDFNGKVENVVNYFLFSCYTGLRYQDIKDLRWENIKDNHISMIIHKTLEPIIIPLIARSKELLPEPGRPDEKVFRVITNEKTNDYLKLAIEKAGINKNISFHCARHTFATVALNSDIPLEVVQKLLGHSMIRTTQIYAKIVNKTIFEQMKKME